MEIDPHGRPTVISRPAGITIFTCDVRTSVPIFQTLEEHNKFQVKIVIDTSGTVGLVECTHVMLILEADLQSRPVVIIVFAHVLRPSVRPHFSKQSKFQAKTLFTTARTVGLS